MSKRDEAIGRAAFRAEHAGQFDDLMRGAREGWTRIGLAAVAEARRLDTCETCEHYSGGDFADGYYKYCSQWRMGTDIIDGEGCNRHQPKEV